MENQPNNILDATNTPTTLGTSTKNLVFDPITGDFVVVESDSAPEGAVVTKLAEDGFAWQ